MINVFFADTPVGKLKIVSEFDALTEISFAGSESLENTVNAEKEASGVIKEAVTQLEQYFNGKRKSFDLKLNLKGTPFQMRVYKELCLIPYGKTLSYGELAVLTGNGKAARAVGGALNRNPLAIVVPCHRVIGANSKLTGFAGGLDIKERLLTLEKQL